MHCIEIEGVPIFLLDKRTKFGLGAVQRLRRAGGGGEEKYKFTYELYVGTVISVRIFLLLA